MQFRRDFRYGKKAGKKHPNTQNADLKKIEKEEIQKMDQEKDTLEHKKAEIDAEHKEHKTKLDMIEKFLSQSL